MQRFGIHLPNKLGLGNLHDSLYVEYWGWEYGLPEKSPPERKHKTRNVVFRETAQRMKIMVTLCLDALPLGAMTTVWLQFGHVEICFTSEALT